VSVWWVCVALFIGNASAALAGSLADELLKPGKAADPAQVPTLRMLDDAGQLRWQVPVVLWAAPREELGGYQYPCGVPVDRPLHIQAPLVFVGYGLTTADRDDYAGQRIEGSIAVIFTGTAQAESEKSASQDEADEFRAAVQKKVENAKEHGAVAVLLERDPSQPPCQEGFLLWPNRVSDLPMAAPTIWPYQAGQLPLPTFSIGTRTLEAIVALSSDLFKAGITTGNVALRLLAGEAAGQGKGLGPVPLALQAEISWTSGQLRKAAGRRCDVWYQTGAALGQDLARSAETCDKTIEQLEELLAVHLDGRISVLLFPDWRSKLFSTGTVGWGYASGSSVALVYEGEWAKAEPTLVHELCHVVAGTQGHPPAAFDEGLARLVGDVLGDLAVVTSGPVEADRATATNLEQGQLWNLKELLAIPESEWGTPERRSLVSYPEAASFCAYVIRRIGFPGFRDLYRTLKPGDVGYDVQTIERALRQDLAAIEADWHAYLGGIGR
jgi:hypothetical protein